ncbi:MAG: hypothetical protein ACOC3T_01745 [Bacteroidota bacterium]
MKIEFKHKKILERLYSTNDAEVLDALKELRETGDKSVVTYLVELLFISKSERIKERVENFLKDIKDNQAAGPLALAVNNQRYEPILDKLLAICWQSGLDFSDHPRIFTDAAIRGDYQSTIEAFTVLEETIPQLSEERKAEERDYLKENITGMEKDKAILIQELIKQFR